MRVRQFIDHSPEWNVDFQFNQVGWKAGGRPPDQKPATNSNKNSEEGSEKETAIADRESAFKEQDISDTKTDDATVRAASAWRQYADVIGLTLYRISSLMGLFTFFILFLSFGNLYQRHDDFFTVTAEVNEDTRDVARDDLKEMLDKLETWTGDHANTKPQVELHLGRPPDTHPELCRQGLLGRSIQHPNHSAHAPVQQRGQVMAHRPFSYSHVKQKGMTLASSPEHSQHVIASEILVPPDMTGEADEHSDVTSDSTETLRLTARQYSDMAVETRMLHSRYRGIILFHSKQVLPHDFAMENQREWSLIQLREKVPMPLRPPILVTMAQIPVKPPVVFMKKDTANKSAYSDSNKHYNTVGSNSIKPVHSSSLKPLHSNNLSAQRRGIKSVQRGSVKVVKKGGI